MVHLGHLGKYTTNTAHHSIALKASSTGEKLIKPAFGKDGNPQYYIVDDKDIDELLARISRGEMMAALKKVEQCKQVSIDNRFNATISVSSSATDKRYDAIEKIIKSLEDIINLLSSVRNDDYLNDDIKDKLKSMGYSFVLKTEARPDILLNNYTDLIKFLSSYFRFYSDLQCYRRDCFKALKEFDMGPKEKIKYTEKDRDMMDLIHNLANVYKSTDEYLNQ